MKTDYDHNARTHATAIVRIKERGRVRASDRQGKTESGKEGRKGADTMARAHTQIANALFKTRVSTLDPWSGIECLIITPFARTPGTNAIMRHVTQIQRESTHACALSLILALPGILAARSMISFLIPIHRYVCLSHQCVVCMVCMDVCVIKSLWSLRIWYY